MAREPKRVELGRASYQAVQMGDQLLLIASGMHPTTGFRELFEAQDLGARVPEFAFFFIVPTGIVNPVVTPFQHHERFEVRDRHEFLLIEDADGEHRVKVTQVEVTMDEAPEARAVKARAAFASAPATASQCRTCVLARVEEWSNNNEFTLNQTLGQIYRRGPCNAGAIAELSQAIESRCSVEPPNSIACSMTVGQLLQLTC